MLKFAFGLCLMFLQFSAHANYLCQPSILSVSYYKNGNEAEIIYTNKCTADGDWQMEMTVKYLDRSVTVDSEKLNSPNASIRDEIAKRMVNALSKRDNEIMEKVWGSLIAGDRANALRELINLLVGRQ
jgi:hypothetical protein